DADGDAGSNNLAVEDEAAGNTGAISENTESGPNKNTSSNDSSMDVDETEGKTGSEDDSGENSDSESQMDDAEKEGAPVDGDSVDGIVDMLREALKQHQRQSKRKAPPNAYSQVLTYNRQSTPEVIQDHNDPFKIEWLSSSEINEDFVIGEKALRIADSEKFLIRYPIRNGCFNVEDYSSVEEVVGDIEAIWTSVIESELGIKRKDLASYGVVLAIPDIFSRVQVIALSEMLLRRMGFHSLLIQQSSTLVTFGAGFSTACVVDVGAQKTSIACVEDGYCHQESRVNIMCGGDDITRFLFNLFTRSAFPYHEASLQRLYDWSMINELRERHCTLNLSDVNIRMHDFFVRSPNEHTYKYSFKTYDEMYQAPLCLFYPHLADAFYKPPEYEKTFMNACYPETYGEARSMSCSSFTVTQFGILPSRAIESEVAPEAAQIAEAATAPATVPASMPGTPDPQTNANSASAQLGKAVSSGIKASMADDGSKTSPSTPSVPSVTYVPDPEAQHSRMPLDAAITHSISHAGSVDKAKKLYVSVVLVGGGVSFIPGFGEVLASRLMYIRPEYLQGIERADIVSAPRDLDPRVLAWKGGAVLSRLECAKEMWITSKEWSDFGPRLFRDRLLFQW
ncbi:actin-like protein arp8, partial [Dipsacomyces acuminosporus]